MPVNSSQRPVVFGEVLFDHFPDDSSVLGGAPFNVGWHLQAFGQSPLLISAVGNDANGHAIMQAMGDWGLDRQGLQQDAGHPTGTVEVQIENNEPSYDIVSERAYDFIDREKLPDIMPSILYHGTLAIRHTVSRAALETLTQSGAPVFLDVNLRPPWWDTQAVSDALARARWVKLNEDELGSLFSVTTTNHQEITDIIRQNQLEFLIITRGQKGAIVFNPDGSTITVQPESELSVVDTVGAGDAFTSIMIVGLLQQWPLDLTLQRAQTFASAVVGIRGATTPQRDFYQHFASQWELTTT